MNWDAVSAVAESVGAVGVVATLVYLAVQIRSNTRALRAATYDSFVSQFRDWNAPLRANPQLSAQFGTQIEEIETLDEESRKHATHVFFDFLKLAENLHYQYRMGMVDDSLWSGWDNFFHHYLNAPGMVWYWERRKGFCDPAFREWVERLHAEKPESPLRATQLARSE
jgi:hypothetical protein